MGHIITLAQQKGGAGKTTLAVNLAVAFAKSGASVALLDTDPQGSMGRWFMTRRESGAEDMEFSTASAWGVSYEAEKLAKEHDFVLIDTPPKIDADLRPALRSSDLVIVPVAASQVDIWATDAVLDIAEREDCQLLAVLNRAKSGTRVLDEVTSELEGMDMPVAKTVIGNRVAYAEMLGKGKSVLERPKGAWTDEITGLADEVQGVLKD